LSRWHWIDDATALAIHDAQLSEHGGSPGLRDHGAFEAAMARPKNKAAYETTDIAELAAAYAYGLSKGHAFVDGNKRLGLAVAGAFLYLNGYGLNGSQAEVAAVMWQLAGGKLTEHELAAWFRAKLQKRHHSP